MSKVSPLTPHDALVRDRIKQKQAQLTDAERRLTAVLMEEHLVAGLQSITKLAERAEVSTPTVIRLARKLGFSGFPDLQSAIRMEIAARMKAPLAKLQPPDPQDTKDHIISRFAMAASRNINATLDRLDTDAFDKAADMMADPHRSLHVMGGRITRSNAHYFFNHLQIIRPDVRLLDSSPSVWPQSLLDMTASSTLIVFDIRRYEKELEKLVAAAVRQGAAVVLFTDQWGSPIEKHASFCFRAMVEAPSSWDSTLAISFLTEAFIAAIQHRNPSDDRLKALEEMIGSQQIFGGT